MSSQDGEASGAAPRHAYGAPSQPAAHRASGADELPDRARLEAMLGAARGGQELADLAASSAMYVELARRQRLAADRLHDVAAWHLRVKRRLGEVLAKTVKRGGDRAKSQCATLAEAGLPRGLDKHAARRCRRLAELSAERFDEYLAHARSKGRTPSTNGALMFEPTDAAAPRRRRPTQGPALPPEVLDSLVDAMGGVDVCVGGNAVAHASCLSVTECRPEQLRGSVVVAECHEPSEWLRVVTRRHRRGLVTQVGVALPVDLKKEVVSLLGESNWRIVMLTQAGKAMLLAYLGPRREAIYAACRRHGLVADVYCD